MAYTHLSGKNTPYSDPALCEILRMSFTFTFLNKYTLIIYNYKNIMPKIEIGKPCHDILITHFRFLGKWSQSIQKKGKWSQLI